MKYLTRKLYGTFVRRGFLDAIRAVYRELVCIYYRRIVKKQYVKRNIYDYEMILDLYDRGISRALWLFGKRELDHKYLMERVLSPGDRVLDVGANIGYYALMESNLVGPTGMVVALEPSPENIKLLEKNIELNKCQNVKVTENAVSNVVGKSLFWLSNESNLNTFHRHLLEEHGNLKGSIEVNVTTVSDLTEKYGAFDLLRMDIEGHEVQVLQNIGEMLEDWRVCPNIIFETHTRAYGPHNNIGVVLTKLIRGGYRVGYVSSSSHRGTEILLNMACEKIATIRTDDNYRTIHKDLTLNQLLSCLEGSGGIRTVFLAKPETR